MRRRHRRRERRPAGHRGRRLRARRATPFRDPYTNTDSQHETEVEPDSFTFGRRTVATFQVGRRFDGAATNIGYAVTENDGRTWTSGLCPADDRKPSCRPERARQRPGRRLRQRARHLAHLDAGARRADDATRDQPLDRRLVLGRRPRRRGGGRAAGHRLRQELDRVRQRPGVGVLRTLLPHVHTFLERRHARRHVHERRRADLVSADRHRRAARCGRVPVVRPNGDLVVVYLWEAQPVAIAASRSVDGGASFGPPVRIAEVGTFSCRIPGFRAFPLPSADVDSAGRVWATWHDCQGPRAAANDVYVATSADGSSWTNRVPVTAGRNAVLPAIGIDATTGRAAIAYHRVGPAGVDVELVESRGEVTRWDPAAALRTFDAACLDARHDLRTNACRLHLRALRGRAAAGRLGPRRSPSAASLRQAVYATRD